VLGCYLVQLFVDDNLSLSTSRCHTLPIFSATCFLTKSNLFVLLLMFRSCLMSMVLIQQVGFSSFVLFNLDCGYTQKILLFYKVLIMGTPTSSLNVSTCTLMKRLEDVMFPGLF